MLGKTINSVLDRFGLRLQRVERATPTKDDYHSLEEAKCRWPDIEFELTRHIRTGSQTYEINYHYKRHIIWAEFATRHLSGDRILDIGSSIDWVFGISAFSNVTMVDIRDHPMNDHFPFEFFQADAANLPFNDASFDVVAAWQLLHHIGVGYGQPIDADKGSRAIAEMARVLAPGGRLIFSTYVRDGQPLIRIGNIRIYGKEELRHTISESGLVLEDETFIEDWVMGIAKKPII